MPTTTPRLGIAAPTTADDFDTAEIAANWTAVDNHPGIFICTLGTRPTWGASHEGMLIYETDTDLYWRWNGAAFEREFPRGRLATPATRTTDLTDATGSFVDIASLASVAVPAGNRPIVVRASWYGVTDDDAEVQITRAGTPIAVRLVTAAGGGGEITVEDLPGSSGGAFTYTARFRTLGTTSTLLCDTGAEAFSLTVTEV